jgi:uracil-DNA glycosylase family 4
VNNTGRPHALTVIRDAIVACDRCPRLRQYCQRIAREKRAAFRDDTYWAKPVPGFGDPEARILLLGLAPAAHGGNRTGRVFTGDGVGGSGDFLMSALHANGLANQPFSRGIDDGLELRDVWIAAVARCAPPDNKPSPQEIANCKPHLRAEIGALPNLQVYVALGRIAFDACWRLLEERGVRPRVRPAFEHAAVYRLSGGPAIVAAYHPSRQNTHTGRLTQAMLRTALRRAKALVERS